MLNRKQVEINYDGTSKDLTDKLENLSNNKIINSSETLNIYMFIISDFNFYVKYNKIFIGNIILINTNSDNTNVYYWSNDYKEKNVNPYDDIYMAVLYSLILLFLLIFLFTIFYCYIKNIDIVSNIITIFEHMM